MEILIFIKNSTPCQSDNCVKNSYYKNPNLVKNQINFARKSKFCSKIEILLETRNFTRKSKICSKIEFFSKIIQIQILLQNQINFGKNRNFAEKSKFCSKIEIFFENRKFSPKSNKSKFYSKIK